MKNAKKDIILFIYKRKKNQRTVASALGRYRLEGGGSDIGLILVEEAGNVSLGRKKLLQRGLALGLAV